MKKLSIQQSVFLDVLRCFAAQMVLVEHVLTSYGFREVFVGSFGVVVFFILSGFLISMSAARDAERNVFTFKGYLIGRFSRIFTLYVPVLFLVLLCDHFVSVYGGGALEKVDEQRSLINFLGSILMLQQNPISEILSQVLGLGFFEIKPYGSARPIWSVAVEWWIYVFFGGVFFYKTKEPGGHGLSIILISLFLFSVVVVLFNTVSGIGHNLTLIWFLGVGGWLIFSKGFFIKYFSRRELYAFLVLTIMLFAARMLHMELSPIFNLVVPYDIVLTVIFFLAFLVVLELVDKVRVSPKVRLLSKYFSNTSYALYLTHFTVLNAFYSFGLLNNILDGVIVFVVCNLVSFLAYFAFDRHYRIVAMYLNNRVR